MKYAKSLRVRKPRLMAESDVGYREVSRRNLGFLEKMITKNKLVINSYVSIIPLVNFLRTPRPKGLL